MKINLPLEIGSSDCSGLRNLVEESTGNVVFCSAGKVNFGDASGIKAEESKNEETPTYGFSESKSRQPKFDEPNTVDNSNGS